MLFTTYTSQLWCSISNKHSHWILGGSEKKLDETITVCQCHWWNEAEVQFCTQTFIELVHATLYTSLCSPLPVTEWLSVFPTAASHAWYHISLKTWKRAASLLRNPCSHENGHDTIVYFTSPKAFRKGYKSDCSVIFFLPFCYSWEVIGNFHQIQQCPSRAGIKLWT